MRTLFSRLCWVPAALWYSLIWSFSSQPGDTSGDISVGLLEGALVSGGSDFSAADSTVQLAVDWLLNIYIRKAAHMFLFFVLTLLVWLALTRVLRQRPKRAAAAAVLGVALAALDEYHQTLVPGRSGELRDVLVDSAGVLIALFLFLLPWLAQTAQKKLRRPERLWLAGTVPALLPLVWVGTLDGVAPFFLHRASQLEFFTWMDEATRTALLNACAPILRQALYLAACGLAGLCCVFPAILSENRRSTGSAAAAAALLCILTALLWKLPLTGIFPALAAAIAMLILWKAFPILRH
jgi:VanZ family protein